MALTVTGDDAPDDAPRTVNGNANEPDTDTVRQGYDTCRELLATYAECKRSGVWPCYSDNIEPIGLPAWAVVPEEGPALTLDGETIPM